jgi:hypothetical protein
MRNAADPLRANVAETAIPLQFIVQGGEVRSHGVER